MAILVTGGAGYIGSHTVVELLGAGRDVLVVDNLCNSKLSVLDRIECLSGRKPTFAQLDIRDRKALRCLFATNRIEAVIHFAGLKAVGESVGTPLRYFDNNVVGSITLIEAMVEAGVKTLVFSSSATVYGEPRALPIREDCLLSATNPYGRCKIIVEDVLRDLRRSDSQWRLAILRYFNPVGAHSSGIIGEDPKGMPNNLMPLIAQVAAGKLAHLSVFGNDYATPDGTGVRDYIHVVDLARGHLAALKALAEHDGDVLTVNLGTGRGYSVLELIRAFERATGRSIPYQFAPRRPGDVARYLADPSLAEGVLNWRATLDINAMCTDTWRWQQWALNNGLALA